MSFWAAVGRQLRHPSGPAGWALGGLMVAANARPNALAVAALDIRATDQVLELGCGPGHAVRLIARRVSRGGVHAIDRSEAMLALARGLNRRAVRDGRVRFYQGQFEQLPFADCVFDKILAANVAYFWHDAERVLREVRRVLRPDGLLSVYVTDADTMRRWKFADPQTHRLYDRDTLADALARGGFCAQRVLVESVRLLPGMTGLIATAGARRDCRN
jgi:ubiquinone/menaquinone biosynthesis C-methylase UbiE